jgi:hypothetical protein
MEFTCKIEMMFIPVEYVGWNADLLEKHIDHLGVPLLERFRNDSMFLDLPGMME